MDISDNENIHYVLGAECNTGIIAHSTPVERMSISGYVNYGDNNVTSIVQNCNIPALDDNTVIHTAPVVVMDVSDIVTSTQHDNSDHVQDGVDIHMCRQCVSCLRCDVGRGKLEIENYNGTLKLRHNSKVRANDNNVDILLCQSCR